jgi:hypothetical protein
MFFFLIKIPLTVISRIVIFNPIVQEIIFEDLLQIHLFKC